MAQLSATRSASAWRLEFSPGAEPSAEELDRAARAAEIETWAIARRLGHHPSPWALEEFRSCLGPVRTSLGFACELARACESASKQSQASAFVSCAAPNDFDLRTASRAMIDRGLPVGAGSWAGLADRIGFALAASASLATVFAYLLWVSRESGMLGDAARGTSSPPVAIAVHGEWTTRTRHLLVPAARAEAPRVVVLLGRLKEMPSAIAKRWEDHGMSGVAVGSLINPVSVGAGLRALPRMLALLSEGLAGVPSRRHRPTFREQVAASFRVLLGAVNAQWWTAKGPLIGTAFFGHTGNADTDALERAMRARGTRTVHVVHGLAAGPNFVGFSDVALFRSGVDARRYGELDQYGSCTTQPAPRPAVRRGPKGLFLLTNLAHPMNPRYADNGPGDEINLLRQVAAIADTMGESARPRSWRPHPVIEQLSRSDSRRVRDEARALGFEEIAQQRGAADCAAGVRWVVCSPSTVAVDLLAKGVLALVLDPQRSLIDSSMSRFPGVGLDDAGLERLLSRLEDDSAYEAAYAATWDDVSPAGPVDLGSFMHSTV